MSKVSIPRKNYQMISSTKLSIADINAFLILTKVVYQDDLKKITGKTLKKTITK